MPLTVKQLETSVNASGVVRAPNPPPPTGDARVSPPRLSDLAFGVFKPSNLDRSGAVTDFCRKKLRGWRLFKSARARL